MKNEEPKKEPLRMLRRSETDKMLGGVAAGIADYFEVDVNLVRFIFVMLALLGGSGFLLYAILWVLMPGVGTAEEKTRIRRNQGNFMPSVLIILGVFFLLNNFGLLWWFSVRKLWPVALIALGIYMLFKHDRRTGKKS